MSQEQLVLRRIFPVEIDSVFDAWSRAELMSQWLMCEAGRAAKAESELRVGGAYRVAITKDDDSIAIVQGEYLEIDRPRRLVFTWRSAGRLKVDSSVVTIQLRAVRTGTELTLIHDLAPSSEEGRGHLVGWQSALDNLERTLGVSGASRALL
jgi:uncharacterized protein YndB with AHSA1/START domain